MNNNIAIIEEKGQNLADKLGFVRMEYLQEVTDQKIDEWVRHFFSEHPNIEKIIIPVRLGKEDGDYTGLRVGLHIRLTKELAGKGLIPIIFVSEQTKCEIICSQMNNNGEKTSTLLFTSGIKLTGWFDLTETVEGIHKTISEEELKRQVLPKLLITNRREQGHQLANEWGVLRLAKFAGIELTTIKQPKDLYFKYRFSLSDLEIDSQDKNKTNIQGNNDCNYLLIDDNALKGWDELLTHIIKSEIINKFTKKITSKALTTFDEADTYDDYESHDLIFLDLRLNKEEDNPKTPTPIGDYSGMKLLKKIKEINKGIQVIILTASNKAWNMKALLDEEADGYFIKESPEIPVSDDASKANYENLVNAIKEALGKDYLKEIYKIHKKTSDFIAIDSPKRASDYQNFYKRAESSLEIAFDLLKSASKDEKYFNFAYLTYYQILEDYTNQKENFDLVSGVECYVNNPIKRVISEYSESEAEWMLKFVKDKSNGGYFTCGKEIKEFKNVTIGSLARISFLLAFKFRKSDDDLMIWGKINNTRNTKAAHGGGQYVSIREIKEILNFVELFLTHP